MAVVLLAPVIGLGWLFSGRFSAADVDFSVAVPGASILFLIGCLFAVPAAVHSVIRWADGHVGFGLFAVVIGGAAWVGAAVRSPEDDVVGRALWIIPIAAFALSGAVRIMVGLLGKRETKRPKGDTSQRRRSTINTSLDAQTEHERQAAAHDLRAAINDLADRGVIRQQDTEWAAGVDLGGLGRRMSEPRR